MRADNYMIWIGALLIWQLYSSMLVGVSKALDSEQKLRLIAIIWALPLLGSIYARYSLNDAERRARAERAKQAGEMGGQEGKGAGNA